MSFCVLNSRAWEGIRALAVTVEVHLAGGLPELAVKEGKDRVRGALLNSRFQFPIGRVTINLTPADLPKEGGRFDLPIAAGVLGASGHWPWLQRPTMSGRCRLAGAQARRIGKAEPVHPDGLDRWSLRRAFRSAAACRETNQA